MAASQRRGCPPSSLPSYNCLAEPVFIQDSGRRCVLVNDALCRLMGLPRQRLLGRAWPELAALEAREVELRGRVFSAERARLVDGTGACLLVTVLHDVTEHKQADLALAQSDKLKSDLINLINHEYANLLTTVRLSLALLRASEPAALEESRRQPYEAIDRALAKLKAYTANFLNLHRLQSGRFELELQAVVVRAVVLDALLTLQPMAEAKRQSLQVDLPSSLPVAVRADKESLSLIVSNLVTNAVKYTPEGGDIAVRVGLEGAPPQWVRVSVRDNGIGISSRDLGKIKEGFFRTRHSRRLAKGFGVGLKVVQELLARHGSSLEIDSHLGEGSTFSFRLPVLQAA